MEKVIFHFVIPVQEMAFICRLRLTKMVMIIKTIMVTKCS